LTDRGVWDPDIEAYYKDEAILGWEWQFSQNWAIKADAIWWEVDNLIGSTTQLAENPANGRLTVFFLTANHDDYPKILNAIREAASPANRAAMAQASVLAGYETPYRDYQALQLQLNRRFADNWALYSNVTFSEAGGDSHGDVFNNTNDTYGENLEQVLRAVDITNCQSAQANRTVPVNCAEKIGQFLGQPLSTINRDGKANFDRPIIAKATGWKAFNITEKQTFTLGGHVTWQSGTNWERTESLGGVNPTGEPTEIGVTVPLEVEGSRHIDPHYWVNLSGAYGFPMWKEMTGEFRLEVQNVTNEQDQIGITGRGEARALRRVFQRPQRFRALFGVRF
jgi:hypothetical protein